MFKPHIGDCVECPRKGVIIPVKSGLCQYCNHERKQRNKSTSVSKRAIENNYGGRVSNFEEGQRYNRDGTLASDKMLCSRKTNKSTSLRRVLRSKDTFRGEQQENGGDISECTSKDNSHEFGRTSYKMDQKSKPSAFKARKPILSTKKGTGEAEIFAEIAEEREWKCFVSDKNLMELTATQFMHVLPKALNKYPLFKLYKKNIQLAADEIHYAWDFKPRSELRKDPRFDKLFALEEELKQEYKLLKSKP